MTDNELLLGISDLLDRTLDRTLDRKLQPLRRHTSFERRCAGSQS